MTRPHSDLNAPPAASIHPERPSCRPHRLHRRRNLFDDARVAAVEREPKDEGLLRSADVAVTEIGTEKVGVRGRCVAGVVVVPRTRGRRRDRLTAPMAPVEHRTPRYPEQALDLAVVVPPLDQLNGCTVFREAPHEPECLANICSY